MNIFRHLRLTAPVKMMPHKAKDITEQLAKGDNTSCINVNNITNSWTEGEQSSGELLKM